MDVAAPASGRSGQLYALSGWYRWTGLVDQPGMGHTLADPYFTLVKHRWRAHDHFSGRSAEDLCLKELYESAEIDGATMLQRFYRITLPMISPVILFNLILGVIGSFSVFSLAYVATRWRTRSDYATWFFMLHLYYNAFQLFPDGLCLGSSLGLFCDHLCLVLFADQAV